MAQVQALEQQGQPAVNGLGERNNDADTDALLRVQEFVGRNVKLLQELIVDATAESFAEGDVILPAGEQVEKLYFLRTGEATVHVDNVRVERVPCGSILGLAAMFDNPQLPVEIRAAGPCHCRAISRTNFHAALQNYPEDLMYLQNAGAKMHKQDGARWERLRAVRRTKQKLKAIAHMRASQKATDVDDEAFKATGHTRVTRALQKNAEAESRQPSRQVSQEDTGPGSPDGSPDGTQSFPAPFLTSARSRQDEAKRRAKVQMIRAQIQLRARGAAAGAAQSLPTGKLGRPNRPRLGESDDCTPRERARTATAGPVLKLDDDTLLGKVQHQDTDCDTPRYNEFGFDFEDFPISPQTEPDAGSRWQLMEEYEPDPGEDERQTPAKSGFLHAVNPFERSISSDRPTSRRAQKARDGSMETVSRSLPLGRLAAIRARKHRGVLPELSSARSGRQ